MSSAVTQAKASTTKASPSPAPKSTSSPASSSSSQKPQPNAAHLAQTGQPATPKPSTPLPPVSKGIADRAREALNRAGEHFRQDVQQEFKQDAATLRAMPAAMAVTYERKIGVVKKDISVLGNGVQYESGKRWSISAYGDGKVQSGYKNYRSVAVTITAPKTKILGGGPYAELKGEAAATGDFSIKTDPFRLNSANADGRLIGKGAVGLQGSVLKQSAKLYFQAQGGVRAGAGYNRALDLAPDTMGTYFVGEVGNHVVKLKVPFYEMMTIQPQVVATRLALKAGQRLGEAIRDTWTSATTPAPRPAPPKPIDPPNAKPAPQSKPAPQWKIPAPQTTHTVKKGDTLWDIAKANSGGKWTYLDLAKANADRVKNPDLIYPGQVLRLPQK